MTKCLTILFLMVLAVIPLVTAIDECTGVVKPGDVPCMIIGTYQQAGSCGTYTIKTFNSNGTLLSTDSMIEYSDTGRCRMDFNHTDTGSYLLNWSTGDSSKVLVKGGDDMASLTVFLFVMGFVVVLFLIGLKGHLHEHPLTNMILKRLCILLGLFLLSLNTAIIVTISNAAGLGINRELFRYLWLVNWTIYLFMVYVFWTTLTGGLKLMRDLGKHKRMAGNEKDSY